MSVAGWEVAHCMSHTTGLEADVLSPLDVCGYRENTDEVVEKINICTHLPTAYSGSQGRWGGLVAYPRQCGAHAK